MPKIKPTTLFCKRTLPILLVDDSTKDSLMKAAMLVQPIADELMRWVPKLKPEVVHVADAGNGTLNALKIIDTLNTVVQPTIIVAPSVGDADAVKSLWQYISFLVSSGGGFVVRLSQEVKDNDLNSALPIFEFNTTSGSYMDIEYKVQTLVKKIVTAESINHHMTIQSVINNSWLHNKLALCLGSWDRSLWDEVENKGLKLVVNVKGISGSPITAEEFVNKVWCHDPKLIPLLNPANALVVRNPSIESKLVLAKVLSKKSDLKNIKFIEV